MGCLCSRQWRRFMGRNRYIPFDPEGGFLRIRALFERAADYAKMRRGHGPDGAYIRHRPNDAPPQSGGAGFIGPDVPHVLERRVAVEC